MVISRFVLKETTVLYFLKYARQLDTVPEMRRNVPAIAAAFMVANEADLTAEELEDLEHREIFIHDQRNAILKATR